MRSDALQALPAAIAALMLALPVAVAPRQTGPQFVLCRAGGPAPVRHGRQPDCPAACHAASLRRMGDEAGGGAEPEG